MTHLTQADDGTLHRTPSMVDMPETELADAVTAAYARLCRLTEVSSVAALTEDDRGPRIDLARLSAQSLVVTVHPPGTTLEQARVAAQHGVAVHAICPVPTGATSVTGRVRFLSVQDRHVEDTFWPLPGACVVANSIVGHLATKGGYVADLEALLPL